jgi:acylphosphatase
MILRPAREECRTHYRLEGKFLKGKVPKMGEQSFVVRVWGQVQGVGFRYFTRERALQLGLRGHAYNLEDGSVEILIAGPEQRVQMMLGWLEHGPRTATVTRMECAKAAPPTGSGFHTN